MDMSFHAVHAQFQNQQLQKSHLIHMCECILSSVVRYMGSPFLEIYCTDRFILSLTL